MLDQGTTELPGTGSFMAFPGLEDDWHLEKPQQPCCPLLQGNSPTLSTLGWLHVLSRCSTSPATAGSCSPCPVPKLIVVRYKLLALYCSVPSPRPVLVPNAEKLLSNASCCSCISQMMSLDFMGRLQQTGYLILWALLDVSRSKLQCLGFISFF